MKRPAAILLSLALLAGCSDPAPALPLSGRIDNADEVVAALRDGMRGHAAAVTVTFRYGGDVYTELNAAVEGWMEAALAETGDSREGDYLRCQIGGYAWDSSYTAEAGSWTYTLRIVPDYYDYLAQEEDVTRAVGELLADFGFTAETSDGEKIWEIYDWLCRRVQYDRVHRKNPYSHLKSTAYGALVLRSATCQGYCAALYRLLRECGVDCRILRGTAGGETHVWVIAGIDGRYYHLDPTWDAGAEEYRYFLRGSGDFEGHTPDGAYLTGEFARRYPIAKESYQREG